MRIRAYLKDIFYKIGLTGFLDKAVFLISVLVNLKRNIIFREANKDVIIPPDYFLYETYKVVYEEFIKDGEVEAREIYEWTTKYLEHPGKILDWGCGVSRVTSHIKKLTHENTLVYGCDINEEMIKFNKRAYKGIRYDLISYVPGTDYQDNYFDIIYGLSIFTHIEVEMQKGWIKEIHRILNKQGIFLFTTHGSHFYRKLTRNEYRIINMTGAFSKPYRHKGHRMMSSYNSPGHFKAMLEKYFEILEFYEGSYNEKKAGGQDLWIVRKN